MAVTETEKIYQDLMNESPKLGLDDLPFLVDPRPPWSVWVQHWKEMILKWIEDLFKSSPLADLPPNTAKILFIVLGTATLILVGYALARAFIRGFQHRSHSSSMMMENPRDLSEARIQNEIRLSLEKRNYNQAGRWQWLLFLHQHGLKNSLTPKEVFRDAVTLKTLLRWIYDFLFSTRDEMNQLSQFEEFKKILESVKVPVINEK